MWELLIRYAHMRFVVHMCLILTGQIPHKCLITTLPVSIYFQFPTKSEWSSVTGHVLVQCAKQFDPHCDHSGSTKHVWWRIYLLATAAALQSPAHPATAAATTVLPEPQQQQWPQCQPELCQRTPANPVHHRPVLQSSQHTSPASPEQRAQHAVQEGLHQE